MNNVLQPLPDSSLIELASAFEAAEPSTLLTKSSSLLLQACAIIFANLEITLTAERIGITKKTIHGQIKEIARQANLRSRKINLEINWWQQDHGPLLVFSKEDTHPYVLIPDKRGHYIAIDPATNTKQPVRAELAQQFLDVGYMFYRTLSNETLRLKDLLRFSYQSNRSDLRRLIYLQVLIIGLGLITPIAMGIIMSQVVPNAAQNLLWQFIIALLTSTIVVTLLRATQILASIRFRLKIDASLQPALWDRLLRLSGAFFRQFTAGDLVNRASGVDEIQQQINTSIFISAISASVSLISFIVMLYYDVALTLFTVLLALILSGVVLVASLKQLKFQRIIANEHGRLTGMLLQFFTAISKLKVSHREMAAFQQWCHVFTHKMQMQYRAGKIGNYLTTFSTFFAVFTTVVLFITVYFRSDNLSFGDFIAFNGLYVQFFAGLLGLVGSITTLVRVIPTYQRLKPILITVPEVEKTAAPVFALQGCIELQNISFRYAAEQPLIVKSFSMSVNPGEFVAIVGPSGSGKSTLFRLLLGLEKPETGLVLYDTHDLESCDKILLRRQVGVVLQQTLLLPGTILSNILGAHDDLKLEDAWKAAKLAELATTIEAMPMGMQTILSENGRTLSMGQRQRLLLARALVQQPKILLLDEATSAIDNETQAKIWQNLHNCKITRIVSSHRPETIASADRILSIYTHYTAR